MTTNQMPAAPAASSQSAKFPFTYVLRWLLAVTLVAVGLWRLSILIGSWAYWSDRTIIASAYNPYPWLVVELCVLLAGVLLAIRSRWVFIPVIVHIILFARQLMVGLGAAKIPIEAFEVWVSQIVVLSFCIFLLHNGRLR